MIAFLKPAALLLAMAALLAVVKSPRPWELALEAAVAGPAAAIIILWLLPSFGSSQSPGW